MYCPYLYYYKTATISEMFLQLTWWCWTLQVIFYSYLYYYLYISKIKIKTKTKTYLYDHFLLASCFIFDSESIICYLYAAILGLVWFVFIFFSYILYQNPLIIYHQIVSVPVPESESELVLASPNLTLDNNGGFIQVANILIHYYIVIAINIWTLMEYRQIKKIINNTVKNSVISKLTFSCSWLIVILAYITYWSFDIQAIFKNYQIDNTTSLITNFISFCVSSSLTAFLNIMYLNCFLDQPFLNPKS